MESDEKFRKIGAGHAGAMFRQGFSEVRAALYPDSNVAQPTEYGMIGTSTQGEIAEARRGESFELDHDSGSVLADRVRQSAERKERDDPGRALERGD